MGIGSELKKRLRGLGLFEKRDPSAAKREGDSDGTMHAADSPTLSASKARSRASGPSKRSPSPSTRTEDPPAR